MEALPVVGPLLLLIAGLVLLGFGKPLGRGGARDWCLGWVALAVGSAAAAWMEPSRLREAIVPGFTSLLPFFVLSGTLRFTGLRSPRWLLAAGCGVAAARSLFVAAGWPEASHGLGLAVLPGVALVAAWCAFAQPEQGVRDPAAEPRPIAPWSPHVPNPWLRFLLSPACLLLAMLFAATHLTGLRGEDIYRWSVPWQALSGILLLIQFVVLTAALQRVLRRRADERSAAEAALRQSLERYRAITEGGLLLVSELDADLRVVWVSPNVAALFGRTSEEVVGTPGLDFLHPHDRERALAEVAALRPGEPSFHDTLRFLDVQGRVRWIATMAQRLEAPGAPGGRRYLFVSREVTERMELAGELKRTQDGLEARVRSRTEELAAANADLVHEIEERRRAEEALRTSEERYRQTSHLMSDYSYEVRIDDQGQPRGTWLTGAFERITGYKPWEAQRLDWIELVHPDDRPAARERLKALLSGVEEPFEYRLVRRDGAVRWISERVRVVRGPGTDEVVLYGAAHDITGRIESERERRELERRVVEARRLESLGLLAGGIAHDYNNLLTAILGNTAMALRELPADADPAVRLPLQRAQQKAEAAAGLTAQMLIYAGAASFEPSLLDLSATVSDAVEVVAERLPPTVRIEQRLATGLPPVEGDAGQIRQLVANLLANAAESMGDATGALTVMTQRVETVPSDLLSGGFPVAAREGGAHVELEVRDEGSGMDESTRDRIFDPFFTTRAPGRGLGLSAVLGIVRGHNGAIRVESRPGGGTIVRVLLPVADPAGRPGEAEARPPPRKVLLVEDDEAVREVGRIFLKRAGIEVIEAANGREALQRLADAPDQIGAVVLDLVMPELGGVEALQQLRRSWPDLPVLVTSGYATAEMARRAGTQPHTAFLPKPFDPDALVERVREALDAAPGAAASAGRATQDSVHAS